MANFKNQIIKVFEKLPEVYDYSGNLIEEGRDKLVGTIDRAGRYIEHSAERGRQIRALKAQEGRTPEEQAFSQKIGRTGETVFKATQVPGTEYATPALEKVGVPTSIALGAGIVGDVVNPLGVGGKTKLTQKAQPAFKGFKDLTLKTLERLKGRTYTSKQEILDFTNMPDLKQAERDVVRNVLNDFEDRVSVKEFANKVKTELLPLKVSNKGLVGGGKPSQYESIALSDELRGSVANYYENIYESPIKTSAGGVHFGGGELTPKNYFAHTRIEDLALKPSLLNPSLGKTRRVIELQSDLFQKGRLESERIGSVKYGETTPEFRMAVGFGDKRFEELSGLEPYRNTWHERVIREEVKQAAKDGKTKLQFPTGETAMKIEGLGGGIENARFLDAATGDYMTPEWASRLQIGQNISDGNLSWIITDVLGDGKFRAIPKEFYLQYIKRQRNLSAKTEISLEGLMNRIETFDISGKVDTSNPIYRFYEKEVGRYLTNKYGAKRITDPQGVSWYELNVPKEKARLPIEAFGIGAIATQQEE